VTAGGQPLWIEIRRTAELDDALCDAVGVLLLLVRMIEEFLLDRLGENPPAP